MKNRILLLGLLSIMLVATGQQRAYGQSVKISTLVEKVDGQSFYIHTVSKGQTLYSIAKAYKISVEELNSINPEIQNGMKVGVLLKVPNIKGRNSNAQEIKYADKFLFHQVEKGNTLYTLSRQYQMPVDEIHEWNSWLQSGFNPGIVLRFPKPDVDKEALRKDMGIGAVLVDTVKYQKHLVEQGQTLYAISKLYAIGIDELIELNPSAKDGLSLGEELLVPEPITHASKDTAEVIVAQSDSSLIVESTTFEEHIVQHGETLYSLSKHYKLTKEEIIKYNPFASEVLSVGAIVRIPEHAKAEVKPVEELIIDAENRGLAIKDTFIWEDRRYYYHQVEEKETLYSISKFYHIKVRKINKANDELEDNQLSLGQVIRIPKKDIKDIKTVARRVKQKHAIVASKADIVEILEVVNSTVFPCDTFIMTDSTTFNVALMLPFYLFSNDTLGTGDTLLIDEKAINKGANSEEDEIQIYEKSRIFIDFYEGFLLAVDSMKQQGIAINLHVYDTEKSADTVKVILQDSIFFNMDLIVGPVYNSTLKVVNDFSKQNGIKLVSPLMASEAEFLNDNPYFIQVIPSQGTQIKAFSTVLSNYYHKNIVIIHYNSLKELEVVDLYKKYLTPQLELHAGTDSIMFSDITFDRENSFAIVKPRKDEDNNDKEIIDHPLKRALIDSVPNIVILPSRERGLVSNTIRQLNTIYKEASTDYDITLCGFSNTMKYENIDMEYFHNLEYHTFIPFKPDYDNPEVKNFVRKYRDTYYSEPNQFGFQGYDVGFYFMSMLSKYGPEFQDCIYKSINDTSIALTQNEFHFIQESSSTGFENNHVYVLMYDHDYDIIRLDKLFNAVPIAKKKTENKLILDINATDKPKAEPVMEKQKDDSGLRLYRKPE